MAASFVLRRFAGIFHLHRLRGFFDERSQAQVGD